MNHELGTAMSDLGWRRRRPLLGAPGEAVGEDRRMKANTSKERTHSLLNQGLYYFDRLPGLREERARPLVARFDGLLRQHVTFREVFGFI